MIELKKDEKLRNRLSENALESIKSYTPDKYYERYCELIGKQYIVIENETCQPNEFER